MATTTHTAARHRLLFVDDEPGIRQTLPAILQHKGFEVEIAASVPEALRAIASQPFDVLISDLNIGDIGDGFTVVSAMRRTQPRCLNFILTGFPAFESALKAIQAQVDDYFVKPASVDAMVSQIRARLGEEQSPARHHDRKTVAALLREYGKEIEIRVLAGMKASPEISLLQLADAELINSLPSLLRELADLLEIANPAGTPLAIAPSANEHGKSRRQQGYTLPMLIEDARLVEQAIFQVVQEHIMELDLSRLVSDLGLVVDTLNWQLQESSRAYVAEAEAAA